LVFAFCLNVGFFFIGTELNPFILAMSPSVTNPDTFNPQGGRAEEILNQTAASGGFGTSSLLGDVAGPLNMAYMLLSDGYLVALMQSIGGFPDSFIWPVQSVLLVINILVAIQLVRGLVFN
jgi:hypothetical protein